MGPEEEAELIRVLKLAAAGKLENYAAFPATLTQGEAKHWLGEWEKGRRKRAANAKLEKAEAKKEKAKAAKAAKAKA